MYKNDCFFFSMNNDVPIGFCTQSDFPDFNCKECNKYISKEMGKNIIDRLAEIGEVGYPMTFEELKQAMIKEENNMTIDLPTTKKVIKTNTNGIVLTEEKEPKLTVECQGKPISFDKDRSFEFTLDGSWINPDVLTSLTSTQPLSTISIQDENSSIKIQELIKEFKELKTRVNRTVALVHNCQRCGASLEVDEHKSIFHCKYCGATYLLGSVQPNSVYN